MIKKIKHTNHKSFINGCDGCNAELSADANGYLIFLGKYYVGFATHPDMPRPSHNAKQRKRHLSEQEAEYPDMKTLCNMLMDHVEKKLDWDSPMQYVREPDQGAGQTCKVCYQKAITGGQSGKGDQTNKVPK